MREKIEKWILRKLNEYKLLTFETWKSPTHFEQYTKVYFMKKPIGMVIWSDVEKVIRPY